jgi:hypothetical protein
MACMCNSAQFSDTLFVLSVSAQTHRACHRHRSYHFHHRYLGCSARCVAASFYPKLPTLGNPGSTLLSAFNTWPWLLLFFHRARWRTRGGERDGIRSAVEQAHTRVAACLSIQSAARGLCALPVPGSLALRSQLAPSSHTSSLR